MSKFNEANMLYTSCKYEEAIKLYEEAIQLDNCCAANCYYNCGVCYLKLKKFKKAIKKIKLAIKEDENNSKYYFNLAYCYVKEGIIGKAIINFNRASVLDPYDLECKKAINLVIDKMEEI